MDNSNYIRFADYFFRAGISATTDLYSGKLPDESRNSIAIDEIQIAPESPKVHFGTHPLKYRYEPETIYRYPRKDYSETDAYPFFTPLFCYPADIRFLNSDTGRPKDKWHSFVSVIY